MVIAGSRRLCRSSTVRNKTSFYRKKQDEHTEDYQQEQPLLEKAKVHPLSWNHRRLTRSPCCRTELEVKLDEKLRVSAGVVIVDLKRESSWLCCRDLCERRNGEEKASYLFFLQIFLGVLGLWAQLICLLLLLWRHQKPKLSWESFIVSLETTVASRDLESSPSARS